MATVDRVKGRLTRLYIAVDKRDLTKERAAEYESSINLYTAMLISQIGKLETDKFIAGLNTAPILEA